MSRIWEALKKAQQERASKALPKHSEGHGGPPGERRRSERRVIELPLFIYGHVADDEPFYEETQSLEGSAHGGLIALAMVVKPGQRLLLTNKFTQQERECRVIHVGARNGSDKSRVGVEFAAPAPDFWAVL